MNLNPISSRFRVPLGVAIILAMFAVVPARADYQSTVLSQGPAGYWRLNETTQPAVVTTTANKGSLGSSADGTYNSDPTRALPGPFAGSVAAGFDGASQSVTTPWQTPLNPASFSVELWVNPAQVPYQGAVAYVAASAHLAAPRSGWYLAQDNGSTFGAGSAFVVRLFNTNSTTTSLQLAAPCTNALGSWYHLVLTYDGTTAILYENGVVAQSGTPANNLAGLGFVPNVDAPTSFGIRSDNGFPWPGQQAEAAMYAGALTQARVSAHYTAATTAPATYATTVQSDSPVLWYRYQEPPDVIAANSSAAGSSLSGKYAYGTAPGAAGPSSPAFIGFENGNDAVSVPGTGPSVSVPALNLNTNTVTITAWIKPSTAAESPYSGIIVCHAGTTDAGLIMDFNGGLGVGYTWNNDSGTYNWSPSSDSGLPNLPASDWAYVALVVRPDQGGAIYLCDSTNAVNWTGVTNPLVTSHASQPFDGDTQFGWDPDPTVLAGFAGNIDEVAMFNRALDEGELYTQYGAAVGGLKPRLFGDLQGPPGSVAAGDPINLIVDAGGTPPLTFFWRTNGVTGYTTSTNTLVIGTSRLTDSASYDVIISNSLGTVSGSAVPVSVITPSLPQITGIAGYQSRTLYPTGTLSFAVSATGGGLKYQWYKDASPIATGTSSAYSIANVVAADAGSYSVSVTNSVGATTSGPPAVITIASVTAGSYEAVILTSGPEAWWRLDEPTGSTNMFDAVGRHNGTYTNASGGATLPTLGATGALVNDSDKAASFSSAGQGIGIVPFSSALNTPKFSIEAWVNTTVTDNQAPFSSSSGNNGCWLQSAAGWWLGDCSAGTFGNNVVNNVHVNTNGAVVPGQWSHVVICYDATQTGSDGNSYPFTLYVNGQTDGYIWGAAPENSAGPFIIGARGVSPTTLADRFFDGQVDEVAVYPRVLLSTEITAHYNARGTVIIPVTFTAPLLSQTVTAGKSVSFTTSVLGTGPIYLQWYRGAAPIPGATTATYAIASTASGDSGTYTLWGTNSVSTNSVSASLSVVPVAAYANATNNLVLHLAFDGDTTDSSGLGHDGTPSSSPAPAFVPGIIGSQALQYTTTTSGGSGTPVTSASYVSLGTVGSGPPADLRFDTTTSFSVGLWVKLASGAIPGDLPFIGTETNSSNNPGWVLDGSYQLGGWQWDLNDGSHNIDVNGPDNSINDGNWHHCLLTVDRTAAVAQSYLDGVLTASQNISALGSIDNNNYWPIVIGQDPTFIYPEPGSATLDDIGIWRRALTPLEAAQIESAGRTAGRSFNTVGPVVTTISVTGITVASGTVTIKFTGDPNDSASAFTLLGSGTVNGTYGSATGAAITGSAGSYTATVPASGGMQFYRIQR